MTKERVAPVQIRLPPNILEALRNLALVRGETVHALVVEAVQSHLAREAQEPEIRALKVATGALADQFAWLGSASADEHRSLLLGLFGSAVEGLMEGLSAGDPPASAEVRQMGRAAANKQLQQMTAAPMTGAAAVLLPEQAALASAGNALGLGKRERS